MSDTISATGLFIMFIFVFIVIPAGTFILANLNYLKYKKTEEKEKRKYKIRTILFGVICFLSTSFTLWVYYLMNQVVHNM